MVDPVPGPRIAGEVRRYWWLFLIRGLFGLALGVFALIYPGATLAVAVLLIGAYLIVDGAVAIWKIGTLTCPVRSSGKICVV